LVQDGDGRTLTQEMTLAASLYSSDTGERQMLFEHLNKLVADDLLVLDRGNSNSY
jgi:hypothetical protein